MEQIIIKTLPRQTATKISEFRNDSSGKKMNRTKIGRSKDSLRAFYSHKTGALLTGLDKMVPNPYFGDKTVPTEFAYVIDKSQITLQEVLEIKHGVPKGYYTNRAWRQGDSLKDDKVTFFQKFRFTLNDGSTILDLNRPEHELAYYMLREHPFVAASNKLEDRALRPRADYYISEQNESVTEKYNKKQAYGNAFSKLNDKKFTPSYQRKVAKALGLAKGDLSAMMDESVYLLLDDYIEEGAKGKETNFAEFEKVYELTQTPEGRERLEAICLLDDLVNYRLVSDNKGTYKWLSKGYDIGQRKEEAVDFLLNPAKQPERDELELQLKAKLLR